MIHFRRALQYEWTESQYFLAFVFLSVHCVACESFRIIFCRSDQCSFEQPFIGCRSLMPLLLKWLESFTYIVRKLNQMKNDIWLTWMCSGLVLCSWREVTLTCWLESYVILKNRNIWTKLTRYWYLHFLKGLYVTFRNCLLTMTPVAVNSTAVSILLLSLCGSEPVSSWVCAVVCAGRLAPVALC